MVISTIFVASFPSAAGSSAASPAAVVSAVSAVSPAAGGSLMMELVEPAKIHKKMRRNVRNVGKDIEKNGNIVEKCCSC